MDEKSIKFSTFILIPNLSRSINSQKAETLAFRYGQRDAIHSREISASSLLFEHFCELFDAEQIFICFIERALPLSRHIRFF